MIVELTQPLFLGHHGHLLQPGRYPTWPDNRPVPKSATIIKDQVETGKGKKDSKWPGWS